MGSCTFYRQMDREMGVGRHQEGFVLCPLGPAFREGIEKAFFYMPLEIILEG